MSGPRLIVGIIVMGIAVPVTIFFSSRPAHAVAVLPIAATTFLAWGLADLLASILERPRLENRSPGMAIKEDLERRKTVDQ
jgi:hypothetical protein